MTKSKTPPNGGLFPWPDWVTITALVTIVIGAIVVLVAGDWL